jgi:outer membrane protein
MVKRSLCAALLLAGLMICSGATGQPTPPVMPQVQEVELPPPVELPAPAVMPAEAPTAPITAAEAAAIALHNQPSVAVASAGVTAAQGRTQAVRSALQPQVALTAGVNVSGVQGNGNGAGAPPNFQASATLRQLVYDYHHTRDLVLQAQAQENLAQAALTTVQADLVLLVKLAFYNHLQSVRLVGVAESNVHNQQQHLALAQARLQSGLGLPYDVVRAQTAYSAAVYGLTVARTAAVQSRVALARLMGLDPRTPLAPADGVETKAPVPSVAQLVDDAVENRPEMAQANAAIMSARHAAAAARTVNSPIVIGSLGLSRRGDEFLPQTGLVTLGVGVQWNALDGGLTKGRIQETEANWQAVSAQREAVRLQVISDVSEAYLNLKTAELRTLTAQAEVTNATEAVRLAEGRYRAGLGVFIDVLDAQAALDEASMKLVNTRAEVEQAWAALERAVGRNLPPGSG